MGKLLFVIEITGVHIWLTRKYCDFILRDQLLLLLLSKADV